MGKDKERNIAWQMYVVQGKSAVEIERITGVTQKTIGEWAKKYLWKEERNARLNGKTERVENIKKVIDDLTEQRLEIIEATKAAKERRDTDEVRILNKMGVALDDGIYKWNKTLENIDKTSRITLTVYLEVMQMIFDGLRQQDEKLHNKTLDFQESHIQFISKKLG